MEITNHPEITKHPYQPSMRGTAPHDAVLEHLFNTVAPALPDDLPGWQTIVLVLRTDQETQDPEHKQNLAMWPDTCPHTYRAAQEAITMLVPGGTIKRIRLLEAALEAQAEVDKHKRVCDQCLANLEADATNRRPCMSMAGLLSDMLRKREAAGY